MSLNDDALFTAAKGYIFVGPVGTAAPTPTQVSNFDPEAGLGNGWTNLGHTAREELPEFGFDGGDTETKGTWQNQALKEVVTEVPVDYVVFQLHQFDDTALELYYGQANMPDALPGEFKVRDYATKGSERSLCMVMVDGDATIAFYARKSSLKRDDAIALAVDEFSAMPIRATFLKDGQHELNRWISEDMDINMPEESGA